MSDPVLIAAIALAAGIGLYMGWQLNNRFGSKSLEAMQKRADETIRAARRNSEKERRKAILESKEEILRQRNKADRDLRSRKRKILKRERDHKAAVRKLHEQQAEILSSQESLQESQSEVADKQSEASAALQEHERLIEEQNTRLEEVSRMTRDEARRQLLTNLQAQTRLQSAAKIKEIKDDAQRSADTEAVKIISLAVERCASDFSAERTVSYFELPENSDLKGRIIGQEGKNIRAFEKATGIQLLLDEEANTVTLSGYHPVKREIARRVLETLVKDGNIHPRRIEDLTRRNRKRLEDEMKREGQETLKEMGIKGVHVEIVKLLGRLKYRSSFAQNTLMHSKEVAYLTGMLAAELRLDEKLARRAGLLHDIGKAIDYEREGTHPEIGVEVARKYGEPDVVLNAIASHHEDCEVISPISVLVSAADSISGARPGARRKTAAEYIKRIEKLEELANSMSGVEQSYAIQAGREIRVIAHSREVDDARVDLLATDLAALIQSEMDYPGKIKVTVIRGVRAVDYAR